MSSIVTVPGYVCPPKKGDAVLLCSHSLARYPHEQGSARHWFNIDPPATISDPKEFGNLDVAWFGCCQGCLDEAGGNVAAVNYTHHGLLGELAKGRWVSDPEIVLA